MSMYYALKEKKSLHTLYVLVVHFNCLGTVAWS